MDKLSYWYVMTLGWNTLHGPVQKTVENFIRVENPSPHERFVTAVEDAKASLGVDDDQMPTVVFYASERWG